jgi:predicted helicase
MKSYLVRRFTLLTFRSSKRGLLVDYKVIVLTVDSDTIIEKIGATITEKGYCSR